MNIFTVTFLGHRYIEEPLRVEERLATHVRRLLLQKEYVVFLVGRNGDFDQFASSAVRRARKKYGEDNSVLVLVLPYLTAEYRQNEDSFADYYSEIEISPTASVAHPRAAIQLRNRDMIDRADLVLCYIKRQKGGAWKSVQYAIKQGKTVINLAEEPQM